MSFGQYSLELAARYSKDVFTVFKINMSWTEGNVSKHTYVYDTLTSVSSCAPLMYVCQVCNVAQLLHSLSFSSIGLVKKHHFTLIHINSWKEDSEPEPHAVWNAIQEYEKAQKGITAPAVVMCK